MGAGEKEKERKRERMLAKLEYVTSLASCLKAHYESISPKLLIRLQNELALNRRLLMDGGLVTCPHGADFCGCTDTDANT